MSPRKKEQNDRIRASRRQQILEAALTLYVKQGYNGTDMDVVASKAGLAKGLVYYYFKTKQEMFRAVFEWMLEQGMEFGREILEGDAQTDPMERLVKYAREICSLAFKDPRMMQFYMRMPFDAYAIFGPEQWRTGMEKSFMHRNSLARLIEEAVRKGEVRVSDPGLAANCFWSVFAASLFDFSRLIGGEDGTNGKAGAAEAEAEEKILETLTFCFRGLGFPEDKWRQYWKDSK